MNKPEECVTGKSKEIVYVFNNLAEQLDKSRGLVDELTDNLNPILTPEPPVDHLEKVTEDLCLSTPFAQDLNLQVDRVKKLNRFLSDLIERVQI